MVVLNESYLMLDAPAVKQFYFAWTILISVNQLHDYRVKYENVDWIKLIDTSWLCVVRYVMHYAETYHDAYTAR